MINQRTAGNLRKCCKEFLEVLDVAEFSGDDDHDVIEDYELSEKLRTLSLAITMSCRYFKRERTEEQ